MTKREISLMAAEWWADAVANPKFDNGDPSPRGGLGMGLAILAVTPVTEEQRARFIECLSYAVCVALVIQDPRHVNLSVDYAPCCMLQTAVEWSEISINNFPWKTIMNISENHIEISYGYGAPFEYLYVNEAYFQNKIRDIKDAISTYERDDKLFWIENEDEKLKYKAKIKADFEQCIKEYESKIREIEDRGKTTS